MRIICTTVGKDIEERALLEKGRGQNHILELWSWELSVWSSTEISSARGKIRGYLKSWSFTGIYQMKRV